MKKIKFITIFIMVMFLTGCFSQNFDEYIEDKGFSSAYDTVKSGNNACAVARSKGRSCTDISFPESNFYTNTEEDIIIYSEEEGITIMGENYTYIPLSNTFIWWSDNQEIGVKYDTKTKECLNLKNKTCSDEELNQAINVFNKKAPYLDDFKGNLKDVKF